MPVVSGKESTGDPINNTNLNQQNVMQPAMIPTTRLPEVFQRNLERNDSSEGSSLPLYSSLQAGGSPVDMMGFSLSRPSSLLVTSPQPSFLFADSTTIPVGEDQLMDSFQHSFNQFLSSRRMLQFLG